MVEENGVADHPQLDNKSLAGTYAQRGLTLPFTTSLLCFSRLRISSEGEAEILVPGLTAGASVIVVPLASLGEAVSFSVYDRSFVAKLTLPPDISPTHIRAIAHQVAELGIAGPKLAKAARTAAENRRNLMPFITINLTQAAIDQLAGDDPLAQNLDERKLATPDGMQIAKRALKGYAESIGLTPGQIFNCFENWGEIICEVGTPGRNKGHLCALIDDMERLAAEIDAWRGEEPPKTGDICQQISMVIQQTLLHAHAYLRETYAHVNHMGETLRNWQDSSKKLKFATRRLDYVLDGWEQIIQLWDEAADFDRVEKRDVILTLGPALPVLPEEEVVNDKEFWEDLRKYQSRWLAIREGVNRRKPKADNETNSDNETNPGEETQPLASGDAA